MPAPNTDEQCCVGRSGARGGGVFAVLCCVRVRLGNGTAQCECCAESVLCVVFALDPLTFQDKKPDTCCRHSTHAARTSLSAPLQSRVFAAQTTSYKLQPTDDKKSRASQHQSRACAPLKSRFAVCQSHKQDWCESTASVTSPRTTASVRLLQHFAKKYHRRQLDTRMST